MTKQQRIEELEGEVAALKEELAKRPSLDMLAAVRGEQASNRDASHGAVQVLDWLIAQAETEQSE